LDVGVVCVFELLTTSEELVPVEVSVVVDGDVVSDVLSWVTGEEESEVSVTTVLEVMKVTTVDGASVVTAVVLVAGGTTVPLELVPACLFANSTKPLATSTVCSLTITVADLSSLKRPCLYLTT